MRKKKKKVTLLHQVTISRSCKIFVEMTAESACNIYSAIMDKIFETL